MPLTTIEILFISRCLSRDDIVVYVVNLLLLLYLKKTTTEHDLGNSNMLPFLRTCWKIIKVKYISSCIMFKRIYQNSAFWKKIPC